MPSIQTVRPSRLLAGETRHIQGITAGKDDLKLRGRRFVTEISDQIVDEGIEINRSIEGASTLKIPLLDDDGSLRRHPLFQARFELEFDGLRFVFVGKEKLEDSTLEITAEARNVWRLRQHTGPEKAYRDKVTRAEFWVGLVKRLHPEIPVYCPELHTVQPIRSVAAARDDEAERDVRRGKGLDAGANLTAKGVKATASQIRLADTMMRAAVSYGANAEILTGLVTALINESLISNPTGGDQDSQGPLQVRVGSHPGLDPRDPVAITKAFVTEGFTGAGSALELSKTMDVDEWLGKVMWMAGATSYPGNQYIPEATKWVEAFDGGLSGSRTVEETKRYPFAIAANETWWAGGTRLFEEVNWRLFEAAELIYVIAELDLLAGRIRMRCHEGAPGIDSITWVADTGVRVSEITVNGRARDWAAPPGAVAAIEGEGDSIDGNYIVSNLQSWAGVDDIVATLKRPTKSLPEPAPDTTTTTIGGFSGGADLGSAPEAVEKVAAEIERLSKLGLDYVLGGGHATPAPANGPFDCSSFVSRCVQLVDPGAPTMATPQLATYGQEGKGEWITLYVHNGGAGGGHTLIKVGDRYAECGGSDNPDPNGGPSWIEPSAGRLAEFESVRHPRGL